MQTDEDIQAEIDRLLDGRSIEDIERELDRQIEERDSTLNSAEENSLKMLTGGGNGGIIEAVKEETTENNMLTKDKDLEQYIGKPVGFSDNERVREWYYANVHDIPNQIDRTKTIEEQARQSFELRNKYKREARLAMSDVETVRLLEEKKPAPTFDELLESKMSRKGLSYEEAIKDILETSSKTNSKVDSKFGL